MWGGVFCVHVRVHTYAYIEVLDKYEKLDPEIFHGWGWD